MGEPSFAIVIPVTHSLADLSLCLESLERLTYPRERLRVVVVDCRVVEALGKFMERHAASSALSLMVLSLPTAAGPGHEGINDARLNEARNLAVARCPARAYVFAEDDISFDSD